MNSPAASLMIYIIAVLVAMTTPAAAYVDPGSGTFLLQIIGASIIGLLYYMRTIRAWLKDRLMKLLGFGKGDPKS